MIDLVAVGFTRELGPLLTAIVVSGRSGSAFSAEIGTMVVTNEIDALRTMALDPIEFVLAPKYLAAIVMVPCLTIMCTVFGILAGAGFMYREHANGIGNLHPVCVRFDFATRCAGWTDQEPRLRHHHRTCGVHGRVQGTRWPGGGRAFDYFRGGPIDVPRHFGRSLLHRCFLSGEDAVVMASPVISVRDLSVSYEGHQVLDRVNLDIQPDEVLVLLGGSGSGKSTLLRHIIGLEQPDSGNILVRGIDINNCSPQILKQIRRK